MRPSQRIIGVAIAALLMAITGCAKTVPARSPAPTPPTLADLQREVHQLESDASHACEQACVSQVLGQCVLLAVEPYEFVSEECVGDKSRACLLDCTP